MSSSYINLISPQGAELFFGTFCTFLTIMPWSNDWNFAFIFMDTNHSTTSKSRFFIQHYPSFSKLVQLRSASSNNVLRKIYIVAKELQVCYKSCKSLHDSPWVATATVDCHSYHASKKEPSRAPKIFFFVVLWSTKLKFYVFFKKTNMDLFTS